MLPIEKSDEKNIIVDGIVGFIFVFALQSVKDDRL